MWPHASSSSRWEGTPKPCPTGALWRSFTTADSLSATASRQPWVTASACRASKSPCRRCTAGGRWSRRPRARATCWSAGGPGRCASRRRSRGATVRLRRAADFSGLVCGQSRSSKSPHALPSPPDRRGHAHRVAGVPEHPLPDQQRPVLAGDVHRGDHRRGLPRRKRASMTSSSSRNAGRMLPSAPRCTSLGACGIRHASARSRRCSGTWSPCTWSATACSVLARRRRSARRSPRRPGRAAAARTRTAAALGDGLGGQRAASGARQHAGVRRDQRGHLREGVSPGQRDENVVCRLHTGQCSTPALTGQASPSRAHASW